MTGLSVSCTRCHRALGGGALNSGRLSTCPGCNAQLRVDVFPALCRAPAQGTSGELILAETEASCFYHPRKRASRACESCGRFLCALCDVELNDQHLCPGCVESGKAKGRLQGLETRRQLPDNIALALALYPIIMIWPTLVTAPITLVYTVRHWRDPGPILPRTKVRFVLAFALAALQIGAWIFLGCFLATR